MKNITKRIILCCLGFALTCFAQAVDIKGEYPRPQLERNEWINLNGNWTFELENSQIGLEKDYQSSKGFGKTIKVPFAPESKLSGLNYANEFIESIWYHRTISIPDSWNGKLIKLNFGAVYYQSEIYIDGRLVNRHFGGSDSFSMDITNYIKQGTTHQLVIRVVSNLRSGLQSAGKQSLQSDSWGCNYTRTTGIWQTVWLEAVNAFGIESMVINTDIDIRQLVISPTFYNVGSGNKLIVTVKDGSKTVARIEQYAAQGIHIAIPIKDMKLWSPENPFLYIIELSVNDKNGKRLDEIHSYAGMRKVHIEGNKILLNNQPYYLRLVLDQGFYPDGIWTAPSDEALKNDILLSKEAGFNGARLHQKVFEARFHYWADKLGYLTWSEVPSWGMDVNNSLTARNFLTEWQNIVASLRNHPSIVVWTPMNEQWHPDDVQYPRLCEDLYNATRLIDPTRPINSTSGGVHVKTDIWTVHNYQQDAEKLKNELFDGYKFQQTPNTLQTPNYGNIGFNMPKSTPNYVYKTYEGGIPYLVDEFGGIKCATKQPAKDAWGYGEAAKDEEEFYNRLESQVDAILSLHDQVWGFCYTQLTDVEQEQNGLYYYDRTRKFDMKRIRSIFSKPLSK